MLTLTGNSSRKCGACDFVWYGIALTPSLTVHYLLRVLRKRKKVKTSNKIPSEITIFWPRFCSVNVPFRNYVAATKVNTPQNYMLFEQVINTCVGMNFRCSKKPILLLALVWSFFLALKYSKLLNVIKMFDLGSRVSWDTCPMTRSSSSYVVQPFSWISNNRIFMIRVVKRIAAVNLTIKWGYYRVVLNCMRIIK